MIRHELAWDLFAAISVAILAENISGWEGEKKHL